MNLSKYTTEVRYICETAAGLDHSVGYDDIDNVLTNETVSTVFRGMNFPIFDETYRIPLEKKILEHYYTREIGFETVGLWKLKMRAKLNEIMPYYNQMYESELLEFNPLYTVNTSKTVDRSGAESENKNITHDSTTDRTLERNKSDAESNKITEDKSGSKDNDITTNAQTNTNVAEGSSNTNLYSDTPQGEISGFDPASTYLTNATLDNGKKSTVGDTSESGSTNEEESYSENISKNANKMATSDETNNENVTNNSNDKHNKMVSTTEEYIEKVQGINTYKSPAKLLQEFRETFLNIDMLVIDELKDLFFGLWG